MCPNLRCCIKFLSSVEAEDIAWFCKSCVQPANMALLDKSIEDKVMDKSTEDKVREHIEKLNQRLQAVEFNLPKKVENTDFEKLQKKLEGKSQGAGSCADITDSAGKRTVKLIENY